MKQCHQIIKGAVNCPNLSKILQILGLQKYVHKLVILVLFLFGIIFSNPNFPNLFFSYIYIFISALFQ